MVAGPGLEAAVMGICTNLGTSSVMVTKGKNKQYVWD